MCYLVTSLRVVDRLLLRPTTLPNGTVADGSFVQSPFRTNGDDFTGWSVRSRGPRYVISIITIIIIIITIITMSIIIIY